MALLPRSMVKSILDVNTMQRGLKKTEAEYAPTPPTPSEIFWRRTKNLATKISVLLMCVDKFSARFVYV